MGEEQTDVGSGPSTGGRGDPAHGRTHPGDGEEGGAGDRAGSRWRFSSAVDAARHLGSGR